MGVCHNFQKGRRIMEVCPWCYEVVEMCTCGLGNVCPECNGTGCGSEEEWVQTDETPWGEPIGHSEPTPCERCGGRGELEPKEES
jgi:hypothetical protein